MVDKTRVIDDEMITRDKKIVVKGNYVLESIHDERIPFVVVQYQDASEIIQVVEIGPRLRLRDGHGYTNDQWILYHTQLATWLDSMGFDIDGSYAEAPFLKANVVQDIVNKSIDLKLAICDGSDD